MATSMNVHPLLSLTCGEQATVSPRVLKAIQYLWTLSIFFAMVLWSVYTYSHADLTYPFRNRCEKNLSP
jgi:hypothetical protein